MADCSAELDQSWCFTCIYYRVAALSNTAKSDQYMYGSLL